MWKMILHHVIIGLLLYSQVINCFPTDSPEKEIFSNPLTNISTPTQINSLSEPINDSFSDIAVDTLINNVIVLSERYRRDENGTVADIQRMIETDQMLPRLTRGEIIDLLENLTKTSPEGWKEKITKSRKDYQRAIMLVMPYTPKNTDSLSIEELYTKPPVTHIVGTEPFRPATRKPQNTNKNIEILALEPSTSRPPVTKRPNKPMKFTRPVPEIRSEVQISHEQKPKKEVVIKPTSRPEITTYKPLYKPSRFSNHRYPDEEEFNPSNQGMKIIEAPSLAPKPDALKSDLRQQAKENKPIEKPYKSNRPIQSSVYKATTSRPRVRTTVKTTIGTTTTTQSPFINIGVPEDMIDAVKDVNFGKVEQLKPHKFSSQYDASAIHFTKQASTTENVRDLLDSIGVLPQQTSTKTPDISQIADTLSPDMRELLMSFGLIEDPNKPINDPEPPAPINIPQEYDNAPYSYSQFKPLPDSAPTRDDMEEFLAGFGLTGNSKRSSKKLQTPEEPYKMPFNLTEVPNFNMEIIPESMHGVLEDIGLVQKLNSDTKTKDISDQETKESHIFNPEHTYVNEGEIKRLNQLFETIKRLEKLNRTATVEDLKDLDIENIKELTKILKQDASIPLDQQNFGPDPLDFDVSPEKNEIKRQQSTTTTEKPTSVETEPKNPSLAALEESFGGNAGVGTETVDESLPPPRKTGFYYLVDWNSFLEVGEDGKNKVNIHFSPQAGDPSRFLRVNVP